MTAIISPRLFTSLSRFYPSVCDIQEVTETRDAVGQPRKTWGNLADHTGISCRVSPLGGGERRAPQQVYSVATHVINLAGCYPAITTKMRAVVAGQAYDILLAQSDGGGNATRLVCQVVT